jgi:hypothetical protein
MKAIKPNSILFFILCISNYYGFIKEILKNHSIHSSKKSDQHVVLYIIYQLVLFRCMSVPGNKLVASEISSTIPTFVGNYKGGQ